LKFVVKVEELTVECWTDKINEHQDVGSEPLAVDITMANKRQAVKAKRDRR
jgi:hypothetical protein